MSNSTFPCVHTDTSIISAEQFMNGLSERGCRCLVSVLEQTGLLFPAIRTMEINFMRAELSEIYKIFTMIGSGLAGFEQLRPMRTSIRQICTAIVDVSCGFSFHVTPYLVSVLYQVEEVLEYWTDSVILKQSMDDINGLSCVLSELAVQIKLYSND